MRSLSLDVMNGLSHRWHAKVGGKVKRRCLSERKAVSLSEVANQKRGPTPSNK